MRYRLEAFKTDEFKVQIELEKTNQERNAVQYLLGGWGSLVLSQLSALSQVLGEESQARVGICIGIHKNRWQQCLERSTDMQQTKHEKMQSRAY